MEEVVPPEGLAVPPRRGAGVGSLGSAQVGRRAACSRVNVHLTPPALL